MSDYEPTKRFIIDAPPADFDKCVSIAKDAVASFDEGAVWGYWSSDDPNFQAVIRHNKSSVSVKAVRKQGGSGK